MMAEDGLTLPSSIRGFVQESNSNPNPNPSENPVKKKRNLPGTPGNNGSPAYFMFFFFFFFLQIFYFFPVLNRSRCRSYRSITEISHGDEPIHLRNLQQRFPERPELAASQARPQSSMETPAKNKQRGPEEGLHLPGKVLRTPQSVASARRPDRN